LLDNRHIRPNLSGTRSSGGGGIISLNTTTKPAGVFTDRLVDLGIVVIEQGHYDDPEAFDCSLSWCTKRYSGVEVSRARLSHRKYALGH
jgi:hypothetical protein